MGESQNLSQVCAPIFLYLTTFRRNAANGRSRMAGPVFLDDMLPDERLSHEDVNLIRVYELNFAHAPKIALGPDTIRRLLESYGSSDLLP